MCDVLIDRDIVHPRAPHKVGQTGCRVWGREDSDKLHLPRLYPTAAEGRCSNSEAWSRRQVRRPAPSLRLEPGHWYPKTQHRPRHQKMLKKK